MLFSIVSLRFASKLKVPGCRTPHENVAKPEACEGYQPVHPLVKHGKLACPNIQDREFRARIGGGRERICM